MAMNKLTSFKILNPYNQKLLSDISFQTIKEYEHAIEKLDQSKLLKNKLPSYERALILKNISHNIKLNSEKMATQISKEMGKPIKDSLIEVERAVLTFQLASEEVLRIKGETIPVDINTALTDYKCFNEFFPLGIVYCITPFNFPINLAAHKLAPAIAAGNAVLFKPHPQTYLSSKMLYQLILESGLPQSHIQLIFPHPDDYSLICRDQRINAISFTGGFKSANSISRTAGIKKLLFELGSNDVLIVESMENFDHAIETMIQQRIGLAGQRCNGAKRIFINKNFYPLYKKVLLEKISKIQPANPLLKSTFLGPLVTVEASIHIENKIKESLLHSGKILIQGKRNGAMLSPWVIEAPKLSSPFFQEEIFGPIVTLFPYDHIENLLILLRKESTMGLQAGIYTDSVKIMKMAYEYLNVGSVLINQGPGMRLDHLPFGGQLQSGQSKEGVFYAIREMSTIKSLFF